MSETTPRTLPVGHAPRFRPPLAALALAASFAALVALSGCGQAPSGVNHTCADKAARATTGANFGVWACLDKNLQQTLNTQGLNGDGALVNTPFAFTWKYVGSTSTASYYELTLLPSVANQVGSKTAAFIAWTDPDGKVAHVTAAGPAI